MHHPYQIARPALCPIVDFDAEQSRATRRSFLERYADQQTLIIGTHFAGSTAGRIVRDGDTYRFAV